MSLAKRVAQTWIRKAMDSEAATIWRKLTISMRCTLLDEAGRLDDGRNAEPEAQIRAGLKKPEWIRIDFPSNAARAALGRRGLLDIKPTVHAPGTYSGWHTPRSLTPLGERVVQYGLSLLK